MRWKGSYLITLLLMLAVAAHAQQDADVLQYINQYKELAIREMQRSGVPASITLAQGIHETQAGKSDLVLRSNNHFGIKCKSSWTGDKVYHDDDSRGECFRSYNSAEDSYRDHSDFLKNSTRYGSLFQLDPTDYKDWAYGLKKAGYATNNRYPELLIGLIEKYDLEQYTLIAMGKLSPNGEILVKAAPAGEQEEQPALVNGPRQPVAYHYPESEFTINNTRVVFVRAGTSLLSLADRYQVSLSRLVDFNELQDENIVPRDQLIYLQRKRKTGAHDVHLVKPGEDLYDIAQEEGIRLESLLALNLLNSKVQVQAGEQLYLKDQAPKPPVLADQRPSVSASAPLETGNMNDGALVHVVKPGETLQSIARKYNTSASLLAERNNLDPKALRKGQELWIYKN